MEQHFRTGWVLISRAAWISLTHTHTSTHTHTHSQCEFILSKTAAWFAPQGSWNTSSSMFASLPHWGQSCCLKLMKWLVDRCSVFSCVVTFLRSLASSLSFNLCKQKILLTQEEDHIQNYKRGPRLFRDHVVNERAFEDKTSEISLLTVQSWSHTVWSTLIYIFSPSPAKLFLSATYLPSAIFFHYEHNVWL